MSVKLPEIFLFEAFAKFLSELENFDGKKEYYRSLLIKHDIEPTKANTFYCYVGQSLLPGLGAESVANHFSGKPIADSKFKAFCDKFVELYNGLLPEEKDRYESINVAFVEWRDRIYKNQGWLPIPVAQNNLNKNYELSSELLLSNGPNHIKVRQDEFLIAMEKIYEFYIDNKYPAEQTVFEYLKKMSDTRCEMNRKISPVINLFLYDLKKLPEYSFDLYERHEDRIKKRSINFNYISKSVNEFECTALYATEDTCFDTCNGKIDFLHGILFLKVNHTETPEYLTFKFDVSRKADLKSNYCIGQRLVYDKLNYRISIHTAVLQFSHMIEEQCSCNTPLDYSELDIYDKSIPEHIRAIFLCPNVTKIGADPFLFTPILLSDIITNHA